MSGTPEYTACRQHRSSKCVPATWVKHLVAAGRASWNGFLLQQLLLLLGKGKCSLLEPLRLSHIIPECHPALKGAVKKMTQEFVKKLMFPLIPCCSSGLIEKAQEVVMRGEELNHIPAAPEPAWGLAPASTWAVSSMGQSGRQNIWALFLTVSNDLTPIIVTYGTLRNSSVYSLTPFCR